MKKLAAYLVPAMMIFGLSAGIANAADKSGEVTSVNLESRTLELSNWSFTYPESVSMDDVAVGDNVKVYFKVKRSSRGDQYIVKRVRTLD